ncbi:hypothetical protein WN51_14255 [Melipona quadrifasciata]|uniref:Uncharacterized protein n=1 Tax=Melipona quadrifasciata TaxID=166423 RepID=A0A0N0U5U6_9HYME|nr:hypothetical protein WN51_14255 [Melipona quadrifasciata]
MRNKQIVREYAFAGRMMASVCNKHSRCWTRYNGNIRWKEAIVKLVAQRRERNALARVGETTILPLFPNVRQQQYVHVARACTYVNDRYTFQGILHGVCGVTLLLEQSDYLLAIHRFPRAADALGSLLLLLEFRKRRARDTQWRLAFSRHAPLRMKQLNLVQLNLRPLLVLTKARSTPFRRAGSTVAVESGEVANEVAGEVRSQTMNLDPVQGLCTTSRQDVVGQGNSATPFPQPPPPPPVADTDVSS